MTASKLACVQLSENALLLSAANKADLPTQRKIWQLTELLSESALATESLQEIVPGMGNLLICSRHGHNDNLPEISEWLQQTWQQLSTNDKPAQRSANTIIIPVSYGGDAGPDLAQVADHCGLSEADVIARHSAVYYHVYCLGFQAGFAYLGGLDSALTIPRMQTPSLQVAAGSVAIGGKQTGIYPAASPGGWHVIGHTSKRLFDIENSSPCLLKPGDRVKFEPL